LVAGQAEAQGRGEVGEATGKSFAHAWWRLFGEGGKAWCKGWCVRPARRRPSGGLRPESNQPRSGRRSNGAPPRRDAPRRAPCPGSCPGWRPRPGGAAF
jgi:hypothetical protein